MDSCIEACNSGFVKLIIKACDPFQKNKDSFALLFAQELALERGELLAKGVWITLLLQRRISSMINFWGSNVSSSALALISLTKQCGVCHQAPWDFSFVLFFHLSAANRFFFLPRSIIRLYQTASLLEFTFKLLRNH